MRTTARDWLWMKIYIIGLVASDVKYVYRSGAKYGGQTYSVGTGKTLDEVKAKWEDHWSKWKGDHSIVTRVYEKQEDGTWKYIARHEFKKV